MTERALGRLDADLESIVGAEHVRRGAGPGDAVDGRIPSWVVWPSSVEEVSRLLRVAHAEGLAVAPAGGATRRHWGSAPERLDLLLSLRRLDRVLGHEAADLTASVEAGVTLAALEARLRPSGQRLPLDPPRGAQSSVGGVIATNASGPYRVRYGTMRELLLGVTVVAADGTVVTGGGRVVKNATGYDMPKLHVGALGTLGVVVGAHLRLYAAPPVERTWLFGFPSEEAALDAALGVLDAAVVTSRLQALDGAMLAGLGGASGPAGALAVTIGSVPEGVRAQGARLEEICGRHGGTTLPILEAEAWWTRLGDATGATEPARQVTLRLGCRTSDLVKTRRALDAAVGDAGTLRSTAEVANGVLHVALTAGPSADLADLVRKIREAIQPLGGTCVVEHAPPSAKARLDVWGDVGPALEIMRRLKTELDPRRTLNPGRFVGGL